MLDQYGRNINYMRISITDRCNLRCRYCMPAEGVKKLDMEQILTFEEILKICRAAADLGISKFKVTGGEPLVRRGCADLIREMKQVPGVRQVTMTTNGQLLGEYVPSLLAAGLDGVNVSLDSLREERYERITRGGRLEKVLEGIDAALAAGIRTKVNCVPQRGVNEDELMGFADFAFGRGVDVRFIELMPVGFGDPDAGIANEAILETLCRSYPQLEKDEAVHGNGPAVYYRLPAKAGAVGALGSTEAVRASEGADPSNGAGAPGSPEGPGASSNAGAVGFISAMHRSFCGSCNRIRLTSTGLVKPCLCYEDGIDLTKVLRDREHVEEFQDLLRQALRQAVEMKPPGHCFECGAPVEHRSMMEIGG